MTDFGEEIQLLRIKRGMSPTQLAKRAGVCRSAVTNIERGYRIGRVDTIELLLNAMGCRLEVTENAADR